MPSSLGAGLVILRLWLQVLHPNLVPRAFSVFKMTAREDPGKHQIIINQWRAFCHWRFLRSHDLVFARVFSNCHFEYQEGPGDEVASTLPPVGFILSSPKFNSSAKSCKMPTLFSLLPVGILWSICQEQSALNNATIRPLCGPCRPCHPIDINYKTLITQCK